MRLQVHLKVGCEPVSHPTEMAGVRPLPCVCGPVSLHLSTLSKALPANVTRVRLFPRMVSHVRFQVTACVEKLSTQVAMVRPLPRMASFMNGDILALTEGLPTDVAVIRLLPRMSPHMDDQVLSTLEPFATFLTRKVFDARVDSLMHPERAGVGKSLATDSTKKRLIVATFQMSYQLFSGLECRPTKTTISFSLMCFDVLHQRANVLKSLTT